MVSIPPVTTSGRSFAAREALLHQIGEQAQDCRIDDEQLQKVAAVMADLPPSHLALRTYSKLNLAPAEFADQTLLRNDADAIQYTFVGGSQGSSSGSEMLPGTRRPGR